MIIEYKKQLTFNCALDFQLRSTLTQSHTKASHRRLKNRSPRKNYDVCHQTNAAATRATQT